MLRGVASARCGSKRRGNHSHSWQSRKKVRSAAIWAAFWPPASGLPSAVAQAGGALDVVTDAHPVHRGDPGRAGLPRPAGGSAASGCSAASHRPTLSSWRGRCHGPAASAWTWRATGRPTAPRPARRHWPAIECRPVCSVRRIAEPELSDGPLHGVQRVQPRLPSSRCSPRIRSNSAVDSVLQVRAAVEQEHLRGHHRQQLVIVAAEPVAPPRQHGAQPADLASDAVVSEDSPGQGEPAEAAQAVELGEPAEQVGVRGPGRAAPHRPPSPAHGPGRRPGPGRSPRPIPRRSTPSRRDRGRRSAAE